MGDQALPEEIFTIQSVALHSSGANLADINLFPLLSTRTYRKNICQASAATLQVGPFMNTGHSIIVYLF